MEKDLYFLIYRSTETRKLSVQEMNKLVRNAQHFNKIKNITGILIYKSGTYVQYIEGKKVDIIMLYEKLLRDERHHSINLLERKSISKRRFSKWAMLLKFITSKQIIEIEKAYNVTSSIKNKGSNEVDLLKKLIYDFEHN